MRGMVVAASTALVIYFLTRWRSVLTQPFFWASRMHASYHTRRRFDSGLAHILERPSQGHPCTLASNRTSKGLNPQGVHKVPPQCPTMRAHLRSTATESFVGHTRKSAKIQAQHEAQVPLRWPESTRRAVVSLGDIDARNHPEGSGYAVVETQAQHSLEVTPAAPTHCTSYAVTGSKTQAAAQPARCSPR